MCPDCGRQKLLFDSEAKANNFIKFNKDNYENGDDLRPYYCPACCGWHLSSHPFHPAMEGQTDKLIEEYHKAKSSLRPIDLENIEILYNNLKEHNFKSRKEVNHYLSTLEKCAYNNFVQQEAKVRYYLENNLPNEYKFNKSN